MRTLFLLRHAKSSWDDTRAHDHERTLARRGKHDAPRVATRLRDTLGAPDLIISSHARRAHDTAKLFAGVLGIDPSEIGIDRRIYLSGPSAIIAVAAEQSDSVGRLMLVGHNPDFTVLANKLARDLSIDNMPTCAIAGIEFDCDRWRDVQTTDGRFVYFDFPKNTEAPLQP